MVDMCKECAELILKYPHVSVKLLHILHYVAICASHARSYRQRPVKHDIFIPRNDVYSLTTVNNYYMLA